jgi:hypothetical protein
VSRDAQDPTADRRPDLPKVVRLPERIRVPINA